MDSTPRTLKSAFAAAEASRLALEAGGGGATSTSDAQTTHRSALISAALRDYRASAALARAAALFSRNEAADDIATADLPYLLIDFHVAELAQKADISIPNSTSSGSGSGTARTIAAARREVLASARDAYERFLHRLDDYGLLGAPAHRTLLARYAEAPLAFSVAGGATADPAARREAKVASFRAEKDLRARLALLRRRQQEQRQQDGEDDEDEERGGDEEVVRALRMAELEFAAHMAFQGLEGLNREWEVLAQAPSPEEEESERNRQSGQQQRSGADGYDDRLDAPLRRGGGGGGPLLNRQGKPLQPFTLLGNRQELARGVFRPGHNLPTMSIDEYLEEERRRGNIIEGGGEASLRRPEPDEDNIEKADAETMKAREWDEFKEANPRGSGNTLNRG